VLLKEVCCLRLDRLVAVALCHRDLHLLAIHRKAAHFLDCIDTALSAIEHDKCLALALQAALGDDVENRAIGLEDGGKGFFESVDSDALFKIADL
jgi:hypothetical protein